MMYIGRLMRGVLWLVLLSQAPLAYGGLAILAHDVVVDAVSRRSDFSITFDQPPDFNTASAEGYPRHGFQYFYDVDPGGFEFAGEDVRVIRGVEIRFGDSIPIRESLNPSGEEFPGAEGWGSARGEVPFELHAETIHFSVPWTMLGETDGRFSYVLFAFSAGELTDVQHFPRDGGILIPLPAALGSVTLLGVVAGLASLATAAGRRAAWSAIACAAGARRGSRASAVRSRSTLPSAH